MDMETIKLLMAIYFIILGLCLAIFRAKGVRQAAEFEYKWFRIPRHLTDTRFGRNLFLFAGISFVIIGFLMLFGII